MKFHFLFSTLLILFFSNCDNPFVSTPGTQGKNIVKGIFVTGEDGSVYDVWGTPNPLESIEFEPDFFEDSNEEPDISGPVFFEMRKPYPNPADGNMSIRVRFPRRFDVKVWMETASLSINPTQLSNGVYGTNGFQRFVLFDEEIPAPGDYSFSMNKKTKCFGGELNQGFFRVFDGKHILWQDIYIGGVREKAPPALRNSPSTFPCSDYPDQLK